MKLLFWATAASGPAALSLWFLAGWAPGLVESAFSRGLYPLWMAPWSRLVGLLPFAVAPLLLLVLLIAGVVAFLWLPPLKVLACWGAVLSLLLAWFVLGWGMNFQRLSWAAIHHWPAAGGTVADLEVLAQRLADRVGTLRALEFSPPPGGWSGLGVRRAVSHAYVRAGAKDPLLAGSFGDPKVFPVPDVLSWMGIAGIFLPFTGEPLVNSGPNDWQIPFTAAHEAAHLRGWSREDEANFLGFWVLRDDPDPVLAYSAWGSALLYVAQALEAAGPAGRAAWSRVNSRLSPEVRADWNRSFAYWERFQGPARQVTQAVNDAYLRSQGQSDGVKSYGRMVDLLLAMGPEAWGTSP